MAHKHLKALHMFEKGRRVMRLQVLHGEAILTGPFIIEEIRFNLRWRRVNLRPETPPLDVLYNIGIGQLLPIGWFSEALAR